MPPSPLFLDQSGKFFFGDRAPPYLRVWLTIPPFPPSQGLDPALVYIWCGLAWNYM